LCSLRTPTLPPATRTNCWILGCGELIVVDPASPYEDEQGVLVRALEMCEAQGQKVVAVWLTHHHGDHVGAAQVVAQRFGVPIGAHPETAARLPGLTIDEMLEDGHRRVLAGQPERAVRCVFTPGHAPGHLCFHEEVTGAMVAGDMVAGVGTILIDPSEGDMAAYLGSLRRMAEAEPSILLPAHGLVLPEPQKALQKYVEHRLWREQRVLDALSLEARSLKNLVKEVYRDTPVELHGLAERSLLAHLEKLRAEGQAVADRGDWRLKG
jgi:glyoxylase-like metal-dependent hydrolase (beta-lactamase superfamily II)